MALYELTSESIVALDRTTYAQHGITERYDLQRLLKQNISVIAPDTLIIAEEFSEWDESKRRIDLLGVDKDANLVVFELKRTDDGGFMELQALRYAAMVSAMKFSDAVSIYTNWLKDPSGVSDAEAKLLQFLGWDDSKQAPFGDQVRIVLVAADFSKELTTSVLWLNQRDLDIRCVRVQPYTWENRLLLDVQQLIPLPEAESYTIQIRQKEDENRQLKHTTPDSTKYDLVVAGAEIPRLAKRWLVFEVVKAALSHGVLADQIARILPPRKWISVAGDLDSHQFDLESRYLRSKQGYEYNLDKFFCQDGELFRIGGRTYALSNQWGRDTLPLVDRIIGLLPPGYLKYQAASDSG